MQTAFLLKKSVLPFDFFNSHFWVWEAEAFLRGTPTAFSLTSIRMPQETAVRAECLIIVDTKTRMELEKIL